MFAKNTERQRIFDFTTFNGAFGQIDAAGDTTVSSRGSGRMEAKDGFLFALELTPSIIFSLEVISAIKGLGGLRAAQQLMTPALHPLLGIPGIRSLVLIANLQSTDAAAGMTKEMAKEGIITKQERAIFACQQTSDDAYITNYFSSDTALFTTVTVPVITSLAMILVFKFAGANLLHV